MGDQVRDRVPIPANEELFSLFFDIRQHGGQPGFRFVDIEHFHVRPS
jgi:hypothetical protein